MYYVETNIMIFLKCRIIYIKDYICNWGPPNRGAFLYLIYQLAEGYPIDMCLIFHIGVLRLENPIYVFCKNAAFLGSHFESLNSNYKNIRNGQYYEKSGID